MSSFLDQHEAPPAEPVPIPDEVPATGPKRSADREDLILDELRQIKAALGAGPKLLLKADEVCRVCSFSKQSLYRGIASKTFPPARATQAGPRWLRRDVERYVEKLKAKR
jgi:predicted DNA-binding transcriptional regulator AlpA